MKAIRGAIAPVENSQQGMGSGVQSLLSKIIAVNELTTEKIIYIIFSSTRDLDVCYPAAAAREQGFSNVPMLCVQEMAVAGSLSHCIRVLILADVSREIKHVYLGTAAGLRPDLTEVGEHNEK